jgi:hypothetical protein
VILLLGVYMGTALNKLALIASNDDTNYGAGISTSRVTFDAMGPAQPIHRRIERTFAVSKENDDAIRFGQEVKDCLS